MTNPRDLISRAVALVARLRTELPLGRRGERAAEKYLKRNGYRIVARNFRASGAEIDLVAIDGDEAVLADGEKFRLHRRAVAGIDDEAAHHRTRLKGEPRTEETGAKADLLATGKDRDAGWRFSGAIAADPRPARPLLPQHVHGAAKIV